MSIKSAVVVLHEQLTDSLILTQRSIHLRDHPGEICFPGGRWERGDCDLWFTALRELHEELGIEPHRIQLVQQLGAETTRLGTVIHPWLASVATIHPFMINEAEVGELVSLPLSDVVNPDNYQDIPLTHKGYSFVSCQFMASKHFIWGATARIMKQLCMAESV